MIDGRVLVLLLLNLLRDLCDFSTVAASLLMTEKELKNRSRESKLLLDLLKTRMNSCLIPVHLVR